MSHLKRPDLLRLWGYRALQVFSLLVLAAHLTLTVLYAGPIDPLKFRFKRVLIRTIGTYFRQDWRIFAPIPVSSDEAVLVRCLAPEALAAPALPQTDWYDISTPLWTAFQKNRFSAYDRLSRPQTYAARIYLGGGADAELWFDSCRRGSQPACTIYESIRQQARNDNYTTLARIGSAFCKDIGKGESTSHVALRLRRTYPLAWSKRFSGEKRFQEDLPIGVFPFDATVVRPHLYRNEEK